MKITITRSFSAKKQIKQYEPIDSFCSAQMEEDTDNIPELGKDGETIADIMEIWSEDLDKFCRAEVKKTIESVVSAQEKINNAKNRKIEKKQAIKHDTEIDVGQSAIEDAE